MADPIQTPALPSTADPTPYVPVSWMAVSAAVVSGLFLVVLIGLGLTAFFVEKKPLLEDRLLIFPVIGVILSFAARRMIRNSEGTRTGEKLANAAWWGSIVAGLGFGAYLLAIDFSIRRDARAEVERWVGNILKDDPSDPVRVDLNRAFISTLDPDRRRNLLADNPGALESEFREPYMAFKQSDIVRMAHRNRGECQFIPGGVKDWMFRPTGVECLFTGTLKCPEGEFPLQIPMRGVEGGVSSQSTRRQWLLVIPATGLFIPEKISRTPYGWMVEALEQTGVEFGKGFLNLLGNGPNIYAYAYHTMIGDESKFPLWIAITQSTPGRWALGGGSAAFVPFFTPDYEKYMRNDFFKLPGGGEPNQEQKNQFKKAWEMMGLLPIGARIKNNPDKAATITITDSAIEVQIPCELPLPATLGTESATARCRLVISCTDPNLLSEVKKLRSTANPDVGTSLPPGDLRSLSFKWRVARVETGMYPISNAPRERGGMPVPPIPGQPGMTGDMPSR
jgi:hypothetical protein